VSGLQRIANRVRLAIARAVLGAVNDAAKLQAVQVTLGADVVRDDAEHFQHYGFTSVPLPGAEGIGLAVGGSTDHLVVINIDDRRFRLKALPAGEVALYDDLGHKVHLTRNGIVIDGAGQLVSFVNLERLRVEADIDCTGEIKDRCDGAGTTLSALQNANNVHRHPETGATTLVSDTPV